MIRRLTLLALAFVGLASLSASERDDWRNRMQPITPLGYAVRRVVKPIQVDGALDPTEWAAAEWTSDFVDIEGPAKPKPRFRTRAKMLWDDDCLYIGAELEEPHVWGRVTQHDAVIFQDPDFEVFIDPDGDTHGYTELEINARGTTWDLLLDKPYQDLGNAHDEWELAGLRTAVRIQGTLNDPSDTDVGWSVEIAIPWRALARYARHPGAPVEGEQWRLNFSRVEWRIGVKNGQYAKVPGVPEDNWVWSPQGVIDMHRPEMWGVLQFTRQPPGRPVVVEPFPARAARDAAYDTYYAQRDFFAAHQRWATSLAELGEPIPVLRGGGTIALIPIPPAAADHPEPAAESESSPHPADAAATKPGFECRATAVEADRRVTWVVRQDRRTRVLVTPER